MSFFFTDGPLKKRILDGRYASAVAEYLSDIPFAEKELKKIKRKNAKDVEQYMVYQQALTNMIDKILQEDYSAANQILAEFRKEHTLTSDDLCEVLEVAAIKNDAISVYHFMVQLEPEDKEGANYHTYVGRILFPYVKDDPAYMQAAYDSWYYAINHTTENEESNLAHLLSLYDMEDSPIRDDEAIQLCYRLEQLNPKNSFVKRIQKSILLKDIKAVQAVSNSVVAEEYDEVIDALIESGDAQPHRVAYTGLMHGGDHEVEKFYHMLKRVVERNGGAQEYYFLAMAALGPVAAIEEDKTLGRRAIEKAISMDPQNVAFLETALRALYLREPYYLTHDEAQDLCNQLKELAPSNTLVEDCQYVIDRRKKEEPEGWSVFE